MFRPLLTALCLLALPAEADLKVCNETDAKASVAIGYKADGAWTSEGWWNIPPYDCSVVEGGDLKNRYYYYRVTSKSYNWPGESYFFCTRSQAFTIVGDSDCKARGYERSEFRQIDTGEAKSFTLNLTAPGAAPASNFDEVPLHSQDEIDPPGTHGEPYSIAGILSHCDVFDATMQCEIHNDGWRYVANSADPTPQWMLEELLMQPPNTPISIEGDMMNYQGLTANVTLRGYDIGGADPFARERDGVQGLWRSLDDASYQVLIHGGIMEELYDEVPTDMSLMTWARTCDGAHGDGPALILKSFNDPEFERCMILHDATSRLVLFPVGAMRDLMFTRVN
ncbi:DUF1036 domain-containing protein [Shimia sp.]|uniref:DUF1036 domain-containing protein n=1 Tax=Shimia sp. TaxID=1954381 RepID=UPI003566C78B